MKKLIQIIKSDLDNKPFQYEEDHTSVHGFLRNREGNHFFVQKGTTGIASIVSLKSVLTEAEIELYVQYSAHYLRKKYIGLRNEYRTENKNVRGIYKLKLTLMPFGVTIEPAGVCNIGEVNDPGHDSNVMTVRGLEQNVILNFRNSVNSYRNIEDEIVDIYEKLTETYMGLTKNSRSVTIQYFIEADVVQIIDTNNANVIGKQKINVNNLGKMFGIQVGNNNTQQNS